LTGPSGREDLHPKKSEVQAKTADKRKGKKKKKKKRKKEVSEIEEGARKRAAYQKNERSWETDRSSGPASKLWS
jgi:hypothetical protein